MFLGIISSCTKQFTIEIAEKPAKLVIESTLVPYLVNGKYLGVRILSSQHIFDTTSAIHNANAEVLLYKNGNLMANIQYDCNVQLYPLLTCPLSN